MFKWICVFSILSTAAFAQDTSDDAALQALVDEVYAAHEVVALGAAFVNTSGATAIAVTGIRAHGHPYEVTEDDLWHIGSDTKAMTASLIARLVEEDLLSWDATLPELLPDLAADMDEAYAGVTLEHLLSHSSGVIANPGMIQFQALRLGDTPLPERRMNVARNALSAAPAFEPGTDFLYSNVGYVIAGAIAEQATGEAWEDLMRFYVFDTIGITEFGFGPPPSGANYENPRGHSSGLFGPQPSTLDNPAAYGPAGTVHITLHDWAIFAADHLRGAAGNGALLSPESYERLHTAHSPDGAYALGWGVNFDEDGNTVFLRHAGSNTMWYAYIALNPNTGQGVLAVTNDATDEGQAAVTDLFERMLAVIAEE